MYATEGCKNVENLSYKFNNESNINFHHSVQQGPLEVLASAMHKRKNVLESLTMLNFPPKYTI